MLFDDMVIYFGYGFIIMVEKEKVSNFYVVG